MKPYITLLLTSLCFICSICSAQTVTQTRSVAPKLDATSIVVDADGTEYKYEIWKSLLSSGDYSLKFQKGKDTIPDRYLLQKNSDERKMQLMELRKPRESPFFKTDETLAGFSFRDLNKNRYKLKDLQGKVVVLNFWFIDCPPCRKEIPQLNNLVEKYKDNADVVFLAIALDDAGSLQRFLKKQPFLYNIISDGRYDASQYGVKSYPTHVVLDRNSRIIFHTTGLMSSTVSWVDKSIEKGLESVQAQN